MPQNHNYRNKSLRLIQGGAPKQRPSPMSSITLLDIPFRVYCNPADDPLHSFYLQP